MRTAKACLSIFRIKTAEGFQYRLAGIAGATTSIFWAMIEITVYTVFYKYAENNTAWISAGMPLKQLISYVWLAQVIIFLQPNSIDGNILANITSGDVGIELCRPLDLYFHWFAKTAANRITPLFWRGSATLLAAVLMPFGYGLSAPSSPAGLCLFVVSFISAFFLCTAYGMLMCSVRLNITWGEGPTYIFMLVGSVLSGGYLPLQLWPGFMQKLLLIQPFAGYLDIPLRLYIGTIAPGEAVYAIGLQIFWTVLFIFIGKHIMKKRLGKIIVQGG